MLGNVLKINIFILLTDDVCSTSAWFMLSLTDRLCDTLEAPRHGMIHNTDRRIGSTAHFTCDQYYSLDGPDNRTCLIDGTWSAKQPSCNGRSHLLKYI